MSDNLISEEIRGLLEKQEFVYISTCDAERPNVAPKFLVKVKEDSIFIADFQNGRTALNLKKNPNVAVGFLCLDALIAYQFLGQAHEVQEKSESDILMNILQEKELKFCVERIVAGVSGKYRSENFEISFPEDVPIYKIDVEEIVTIGPGAKLIRKHRESIFQSKPASL